ncbi:MAG: hypothetical protein Q7R39_11495 [Dehalococcoidia bacterium]|nr:hypothetical protein [Dehalococcoidia bacterium]
MAEAPKPSNETLLIQATGDLLQAYTKEVAAKNALAYMQIAQIAESMNHRDIREEALTRVRSLLNVPVVT